MEGERAQVYAQTLGVPVPRVIWVRVFFTSGKTFVRGGLLDIWVPSPWSPVPPLTNDRPDIFQQVTLLLLVNANILQCQT